MGIIWLNDGVDRLHTVDKWILSSGYQVQDSIGPTEAAANSWNPDSTYLKANLSAARIFRAIVDQIGITGWEVPRASMLRPEETEKILGKLMEINAVRADGRGLDAYYLPSKEAFLFKKMI